MKRISDLFVSFSMAAACAVSCDMPNEMDPIDYTDPADLRITAAVDGLGDFGTNWAEGDRIGIYVDANDEPTDNLPASLTSDGYFACTADPFYEGDRMYAYYPYSSFAGSAKLMPMQIPSEQIQHGRNYAGYDWSTNPMVADVYPFPSDSDDPAVGNVHVRFNPLGAVIEFAVSGKFTDEKIQYVTFSADNVIAGDFVYDIMSPLSEAIDAPTGSSEVTTTLAEPASVSSDASPVYMTVIPGTLSGTVKVRTELAVYTFVVDGLTCERARVKQYALVLSDDNRRELIGTGINPYILNNADDLLAMKGQLVKDSQEEVYFKLNADIDMTGIDWTPLDTEGNCPVNFDGQGHKISNLNVSGDAASFFGHLWGTVKNVTFENATVTATGSRAGVAAATVGLSGRGNDHAGHLENVHASGTVTQTTNTSAVGWTGQAGGLVGELAYTGSSMRNCSADVDVTGDFVVGGLVGQANNASVIENCFAAGDVRGGAILPATPLSERKDGLLDPTGYNYINVKLSGAGGLIGSVSKTTVKNCYATGSVTNTDPDRGVAGGLAGVTLWSAVIEDCYASGNVTGTVNAGGILGASAFYIHSDCLVTQCIAWCDCVRATGKDENSARVTGYYWIDAGGALRSNYAKKDMVVNTWNGNDAYEDKDTSENQGDMDSSIIADKVSVFNHGLDAEDIIATAGQLGWDASVWDLSGTLPRLAWENE